VRLSSNQVGEIRVKGPLFSSYFKDPKKTSESYDEEKYFKTGDLGEVDKEGRLYYKGRLKEMVKSGGINIAPIEVEEVLMRHPKVRTAFVIGIEDKQLDEKLAAFLVLKEEVNLEIDEIKSFCKEEMAAYKVPSIFRIIKDSELPLTTTGKIQKMKLNQLLI
jgi:fatty-acyl-CoA synthase